MAISLKKPSEISTLARANQFVAQTLEHLRLHVKPGMSLAQINKMGEDFLASLHVRPAFKGLYGFPGGVCTSLNQVVIHGIPNDTIVQEGDILGLDIGSEYKGWYGDAAITMGVGNISPQDEELIACAKDALYASIGEIREGMRFKELSYFLENFILERGYVPLRGFCGHGIGRKPHEEPEIPNYVESPNPKQGPKIKNGMVFCIEPMVCQKDGTPVIKDDKWSVISKDGLRTSHYEHTVAIIDGRAKILSSIETISH